MNNINFDLNLIKTFVLVYESGSTLKASEKLFVSQPAVTQGIKKLEDELGCELFIRLSKGMKPTTQGDVLYDCFKRALNNIEQGVNLLDEMNDMEYGAITIGSGSTILRGLLLPFIFMFREKHPKIKISIVDGISTQLMDSLKRGDVDFSIVSEPTQLLQGMSRQVITKIEDCFIVNKDFPYDFISKDDLNKYSLIIQKQPSSNRVFLDQLCTQNKIKITPSLETESFGIIIDFVSNTKNMIGFSTKTFIQKDLKEKPIKILNTDIVILPREISVLQMKDRIMSKSARAFLTELNSYFQNC